LRFRVTRIWCNTGQEADIKLAWPASLQRVVRLVFRINLRERNAKILSFRLIVHHRALAGADVMGEVKPARNVGLYLPRDLRRRQRCWLEREIHARNALPSRHAHRRKGLVLNVKVEPLDVAKLQDNGLLWRVGSYGAVSKLNVPKLVFELLGDIRRAVTQLNDGVAIAVRGFSERDLRHRSPL
jgi:hypothetical protein